MYAIEITLLVLAICLAVFIFLVIPNAKEIKEENDAIHNDSIEDSEEMLFM